MSYNWFDKWVAGNHKMKLLFLIWEEKNKSKHLLKIQKLRLLDNWKRQFFQKWPYNIGDIRVDHQIHFHIHVDLLWYPFGSVDLLWHFTLMWRTNTFLLQTLFIIFPIREIWRTERWGERNNHAVSFWQRGCVTQPVTSSLCSPYLWSQQWFSLFILTCCIVRK